MGEVAVLASCIMDLSFRVQKFPEAGETVSCEKFHTGFGGKGANQAVAAAKTGAEVWVFGGVGSDHYGSQTVENFKSFGIDCSGLQEIEAAGTGLASIYVDSGGGNEIVIAPRANHCLEAEDLHNLPENWFDVDFLAGVLELEDNILTEAFRRANRAGTTTVLNGAPARDIPDRLMELTDCLIVNETEAQTLAGIQFSESDSREILTTLSAQGPDRIILTLGAEGALVYEEGEISKAQGHRTKVVDTTGAGDAFIGRYLSSRGEGNHPLEAVEAANVYAARTVTAPGTKKSFPILD